MHTPTKAMIIEMKVSFRKFSPNAKYAMIAAINGIVANMKRVTAAVVIVIENINPVIAIPRQKPPTTPGKPTFAKFL